MDEMVFILMNEDRVSSVRGGIWRQRRWQWACGIIFRAFAARRGAASAAKGIGDICRRARQRKRQRASCGDVINFRSSAASRTAYQRQLARRSGTAALHLLSAIVVDGDRNQRCDSERRQAGNGGMACSHGARHGDSGAADVKRRETCQNVSGGGKSMKERRQRGAVIVAYKQQHRHRVKTPGTRQWRTANMAARRRGGVTATTCARKEVRACAYRLCALARQRRSRWHRRIAHIFARRASAHHQRRHNRA
jgi:hypothetical protein